MTSEFPNAEFWLPPEFLTDDDILMDFKPKPLKKETDSVLNFPFDYSTGFNSFNPHSGLSSPVDSVVSSESEEEEYLAGLTRKMANSSLSDNMWKTDANKNWGISVSPQSTLCGCNQGSSRGSPNCLSPPTAAAATEQDLLYQAAAEVARMRMNEEATAYYRNRGLGSIESNLNLGFQSNNHFSYQQLQLAKFQQLKREQLLSRLQALQQTRHVAQPRVQVGDRPPANLSAATWPTLQQSFQSQPQQQLAAAGSGMRAVYLGNTEHKRERAGTGVFLPRRPGTTVPPKNSGGSTVLLPERVVQALNLNLGNIETNFGREVNNCINGPKSHHRAQADLRLPQEWTY